MQLVQHVGSQAEGAGSKRLTAAQRSTSRNIHVFLHLGCNLCPLGVPELEVGMEIGEDLCEHVF